VAAAGNDAQDVYGNDGTFGTNDDFSPAAYPEVATISAFGDSDGQPGGRGPDTSYSADDAFASFSNYSQSVVSGHPVDSPGAAIDLLCPGVDIYSANKNGGYTTFSGTSMAGPPMPPVCTASARR
jgi:subtilisin family serine protease